jgi:hypothetical protein
MQTLLLTVCLVACATQPPAAEPSTPAEIETVQPNEAEYSVTKLHYPYDNFFYKDGLRWIMQHPDEAHPVLVARLDARGTGHHHIPRVLAMLGRAEGVPPLERALWGDSETLAGSAGIALGHHPHEDAFAALIRALQSDAGPQVLGAAIEGLRRRKDPAACPALRSHLHHADSSVRYYTLRACAELGCIERGEIAPFVDDPHPDVAALASGLLEGGQGAAQGNPAASEE